jgi:hypothetical protein
MFPNYVYYWRLTFIANSPWAQSGIECNGKIYCEKEGHAAVAIIWKVKYQDHDTLTPMPLQQEHESNQ